MRSRYVLPLPVLLLVLASAAAAPPARTDAHGDPLPAGALARLGAARFHDASFISDVAVAPDGKTVAVAASTGIRLLDLATGKETRALKAKNAGSFAYLAYAADGKTLGAVDPIGRLRVWDVATGELLRELGLTPGPAVMARLGNFFTFSADGKHVAVANDTFGRPGKSHAIVYEVATGKQEAEVEILPTSNAHAYLSPDGKLLATSGQAFGPFPAGGADKQREINQSVQLWEVATGKELHRLRDERGTGIAGVAFAPDGKQLVAATGNGSFVIWDVTDGKQVRRFAGRRNLGTSLAYSPDGKTLAAGSTDGAVEAWGAATGRRLGLYDIPRNATGRTGFTADGRLLAWGSMGQAVYVWDVLTGKSLTPAGGHQGGVGAIGFAPGGRVVTASWDGAVLSWDAAGKEINRVRLGGEESALFGTTFYRGSGTVFSPDLKYVLANDSNGVHLFETARGREVCMFVGNAFTTGLAASFSGDGRTIALGTVDFTPPATRTPVVRLHDVATGQEVRELRPPPGDLRAAALAPDGKTVAVAMTALQGMQKYELFLWEASSGKLLWQSERTNTWAQGLAFSPDGKALAVLEPSGEAALYDAAAGGEPRRLGAAAGGASMIAFSPDGRLLALTTYNPADHQAHVRLYEVASGTLRQEFAGHDSSVSALAFATDRKRLATGSNDTTVLLWDLSGGADADAPRGKPGAEELEKLWVGLNDADAAAGLKAMRRLESAPEEAVTLLAKHVSPAAGEGSEAEIIAKLIAALDSDVFEEREKASRELEGFGKAARPALTKSLAANPSAEAKQRLEQLLAKIKDKGPAQESARPLRAVEVLEDLGTPEAKKLLEALAKGRPGAPLTVAAKQAQDRLGRADKP